MSLCAFGISTSVILGIYALEGLYRGVNFSEFISSNVLAVSASTTTSSMILSYDVLLKSIQAVSLVSIIIMFFMLRTMLDKWAGLISFLIYVNILILYAILDLSYFDQDLFNEVLPVFISIALGIVIYLIMYFFVASVKEARFSNAIAVGIIFSTMLPLAYFSQKELLNRDDRTSTINKEVLKAYQRISSDFLPYSYAVINSNALQPISVDSHNFITYRDFTSSYSERDSVYFANRTNKIFLRLNTEYILPNSLLVFVYNDVERLEFNGVSIDNDLVLSVSQQMDKLRNRGRQMSVFYQGSNLTVYEVVNNPGEARIEEML
jgi:signal transduction histidine kinase